MRKIKILVLLIAILSITIYSCTDNKSIDNQAITQKSISLRTMLNQIKKNNNISGRSVATDSICFEFVYPLNLSYNNGTTVSITSYDGLISLLQNENNSFFIDSVEFPFQIIQNFITITINNEEEFINTMNSCGYNVVSNDIYGFGCFEMVYPFSVINDINQTIVVNNSDEFYNLFANSNPQNYIVDFIYPFSVIQFNQTIVVNNLYDLFNLLNTCDDGNVSCICTTEVNPVCVNDSIGNVVTFGNPCLAQCAGYSNSDFVNCGINPSGFSVQLGTCFEVNCPVQVNYQNIIQTVNLSSELNQYYNSSQQTMPLFSYPITIKFLSQNTIFTVNSQTQFETLINQNCN